MSKDPTTEVLILLLEETMPAEEKAVYTIALDAISYALSEVERMVEAYDGELPIKSVFHLALVKVKFSYPFDVPPPRT